MTVRIAMWSGPRNISTAMMRSFGARHDTFVSDEPFYGAYLAETGADHPMRDEVIASMDCDWHRVARTLSGAPPGGAAVWYQKHMSHHMVGPLKPDDLEGVRHAFLIRDPARMIASYRAKRELADARELGLWAQRAFFDREADRLGRAPPVVDSADVLAGPARVLKKLCSALGIAWDPAMLGWKAGRRQTDGIWAAHWYGAVEKSTGFGPPPGRTVTLDRRGEALRRACQADYDYLHGFRLGRR